MTVTIENAATRAASRVAPWDVMGSSLDVTDAPLRDVLATSGLDFEVRSTEIAAFERSTPEEPIALANFIAAPTFQAIVRPMPDGSTKVLNVPGTRYSIVQNTEAFAVADALREQGAKITGAADFRGGGSSLLALTLPHEVVVRAAGGREDVTGMNLLIVNPHDGSGSVSYALTPLRLACTNALQATFRNAQRTWRVRHTSSAQVRVEEAQRAIMHAAGYAEQFEAVAQRMADARMTDAAFKRIVEDMWKVDDDDESGAATRKRAQRQEVLDLYEASTTIDGLRGTYWGGYNAITEYLDHMRPVRVRGEHERAVRRAEGALVGDVVTRKENLFERFAKLATA